MPLSRGKSQKRNASGKGVANSVQNSRNSSQPGADESSDTDRIVLTSSSRPVGTRKRNFQPTNASDGDLWEPPRTRSRSALLAASPSHQNSLIVAAANVVVSRSTIASPNTSAQRSPVPSVPAELVWSDSPRSNLFASPKGTLKSLLKGSKSDRAARTLVVAESNISSATLIESGGGEEFSNEPFTFDAGDSSSSSLGLISSTGGPISFDSQSLAVGNFPAMCCVDGSGSHNCQLNRLPVPPVVADTETSAPPPTSALSSIDSVRVVPDMPSTSATGPPSCLTAEASIKPKREKSGNSSGTRSAAVNHSSETPAASVPPTTTTQSATAPQPLRSNNGRSGNSYNRSRFYSTTSTTQSVHPFHLQTSNGFPFSFAQAAAAHQSGLNNFSAHYNVQSALPAWLGIPGIFWNGSQPYFHPTNIGNTQAAPQFAHISQQYHRSVDMVASVNALHSLDAAMQSTEPFRSIIGSLVSAHHAVQDLEATFAQAAADRLQRNPRGLSRPEICTLPSWRWRVADTCKSDSQTSCVVCMCDFEPRQLVRALTCRHVFHSKCVDKWLKTNRTCPICRSESIPQSQTIQG